MNVHSLSGIRRCHGEGYGPNGTEAMNNENANKNKDFASFQKGEWGTDGSKKEDIKEGGEDKSDGDLSPRKCQREMSKDNDVNTKKESREQRRRGQQGNPNGANMLRLSLEHTHSDTQS